MKKKFTDDQINALKYLIFRSRDAGEETKKACFALIDASEGFTKSVCYSSKSKDIAYGVHGMCSSNGSTHLHAMMRLLGTKFSFTHHDGHFENGEFILKGSEMHTIWLSLEKYSKKAIVLTRDQVKKIKLEDPLYHL